ncbi:MAG: hypothetical protein AAF900_02490 [Bacteroidota bacterium]
MKINIILTPLLLLSFAIGRYAPIKASRTNDRDDCICELVVRAEHIQQENGKELKKMVSLSPKLDRLIITRYSDEQSTTQVLLNIIQKSYQAHYKRKSEIMATLQPSFERLLSTKPNNEYDANNVENFTLDSTKVIFAAEYGTAPSLYGDKYKYEYKYEYPIEKALAIRTVHPKAMVIFKHNGDNHKAIRDEAGKLSVDSAQNITAFFLKRLGTVCVLAVGYVCYSLILIWEKRYNQNHILTATKLLKKP